MTIKATDHLALTFTMTMDTMIGVTMDEMMMIIPVQIIGMITVMMTTTSTTGSTEYNLLCCMFVQFAKKRN